MLLLNILNDNFRWFIDYSLEYFTVGMRIHLSTYQESTTINHVTDRNLKCS